MHLSAQQLSLLFTQTLAHSVIKMICIHTNTLSCSAGDKHCSMSARSTEALWTPPLQSLHTRRSNSSALLYVWLEQDPKWVMSSHYFQWTLLFGAAHQKGFLAFRFISVLALAHVVLCFTLHQVPCDGFCLQRQVVKIDNKHYKNDIFGSCRYPVTRIPAVCFYIVVSGGKSFFGWFFFPCSTLLGGTVAQWYSSFLTTWRL